MVLSARGIDFDGSCRDYFHAVAGFEGERSAFPQHARDLGVGVFESEVAVTGAGDGEIGDFAHHLDGAEHFSKQFADDLVEFANAECGQRSGLVKSVAILGGSPVAGCIAGVRMGALRD